VKLKDAHERLRREDLGEVRIIDSARLKGDVLVVISEHERHGIPDVTEPYTERRWALFRGTTIQASGIIATGIKEES
jgi:hypothetical protein